LGDLPVSTYRTTGTRSYALTSTTDSPISTRCLSTSNDEYDTFE